MNRNALSARIVFFCILLLVASACRKSTARPEYAAGTNENINSWVLDSMKVYYYWNNSLPASPDISRDPTIFFSALKNSADRFSALVNPNIPSSYPASLVHTLGFDMVALQSGEAAVQIIITLVVPGSRAAGTGLQRGDVVKTINGTIPTAANITTLTSNMITDGAAILEIAGREGSLTISKLISSEDPVYTYKVFQSGGKTYGYLFLNSFEEPALTGLTQAFTYFKLQQVQELLVDLRYNPGGSVPVAAALAAMLGNSAAAGDTFVDYRGNANAGIIKSSFAAELGKLPQTVRKSFTQLTAYRLGLPRVYLLTGGHTASAAELLVNALKPYTTVIQVGAQTLGKDMASFVIKDYRSPQVVQQWELYPMIFKLFNAAGTGNYSSGLVPDQAADELSDLPLKPFGDLGDPLIRRCLLVSGGGVVATLKERTTLVLPSVLFDSRASLDVYSPGVTIARP